MRRFRLRVRGGALAAAAAASVAAVAVATRPALNNDVTYALGGIATAGAGGVSVWDVFVARPVVYRLLLAGLDGGRFVLAGDASPAVTHLVLRLQTVLLVAAATVVLFAGLKRFVPAWAAGTAAAAAGLALAVSPPWHFLEPDWVAALFAVLAVGAATAPKRLWVGAVLGGLAAALTVAVKLATVPLALLALLMVAALDRRRAAWAAAATAAWVALWYALTRVALPWEWRWLSDQAALVHNSPIHHGLRWSDIHKLIDSVADVAVLNPIVAVAPAAAVALVHPLVGRRRWWAAATAVAAAGLSVAAAYGQGEFFMYHFAVVPVLAAAVWGTGYALRPAARVPLLAATAAVAAVSLALTRMPGEWRRENLHLALAGYVAAAVAAAVAVVRLRGRTVGRPERWWAAAVVAVCMAQMPATLPGSPYAFAGYNYAALVRPPDEAALIAVSERIGRGTPVLYLTFGHINHAMGNPTSCRYPSPQWLQRGAYLKQVRAYDSYADNLRCVTGDRRARYLVWQHDWFRLKWSAAEVRTVVEQRFDCSPASRVPAPKSLTVCPARQ